MPTEHFPGLGETGPLRIGSEAGVVRIGVGHDGHSMDVLPLTARGIARALRKMGALAEPSARGTRAMEGEEFAGLSGTGPLFFGPNVGALSLGVGRDPHWMDLALEQVRPAARALRDAATRATPDDQGGSAA